MDTNIQDIALLAGVSKSTVSRVLNNHPDVSEKTRQKVLQVIEAQSFIPNNSARNLKREPIRAVAVVVKGFTNPLFTQMLTIIQKKLEEHDYLMLLHQVDPVQNEIEEAISFVKEKKPKGLIFLGGNFQHQREKTAMLGVPFIMVTISMHKKVDRNLFSSVTVDDYAEGYAIADKICKAGHTNVAAIGYRQDDKSISRLRIEGFLQALRDNGTQPDENCVAYAGTFAYQAGYQAAQKLIRADSSKTCLFCISDMLALGAMRALHDEGLRVPEDVSVVGFDGVEAGRYNIPSLATVKQPYEEMANQSVQILLGCMEKKQPHQHIIFKAEYLDGESFAAQPSKA
ncbi:LacI family transcriptional regulator [Ruminococcaceae bacterium OttesenSCG-928-A16]|nr:LacI family transcriptional regulator [Ruminococcaceae bacterium OttesenSCG-928-A16]